MSTTKFCTNCGSPLAQQAFCTNCGRRVSAKRPQAIGGTESENKPLKDTTLEDSKRAGFTEEASTGAPLREALNQPNGKRQLPKTRRNLVVASVIIVALLGSAVAYTIYRSQETGTSASRTSSAQVEGGRPPQSKNVSHQPSSPAGPGSSRGSGIPNGSGAEMNPLVDTSSTAGGNPVLRGLAGSVFTRYFHAVNDHNAFAASSEFTVGASISPAHPAGFKAFSSGISTTHDDHISLLSVAAMSDGDFTAEVAFTSHQAAKFGPNGWTCAKWDVTYHLVGASGHLEIKDVANAVSRRCS